jgi:hypothetical protein
MGAPAAPTAPAPMAPPPPSPVAPPAPVDPFAPPPPDVGVNPYAQFGGRTADDIRMAQYTSRGLTPPGQGMPQPTGYGAPAATAGGGYGAPAPQGFQPTWENPSPPGMQPGTGFDPANAQGGLSGTDPTPMDPLFISAAQEFGLDPALLKAMAYIESGGTFSNDLSRDDGFGDGLSVGVMQVKPSIWGGLVPGADPYTPEGNIRLGAAIMKQAIDQYGSWEAALTNVYFPTDDPNGNTQAWYVDQVKQLMGQYSGPTWQDPAGTGAQPAAQSWGGQPLPLLVGGFEALNDDAPYIAQASAKWGVPPSVLGALLIRESSGDYAGNGNNGQPRYDVRPESGGLLPYVGMFQTTAESYGIDFNSLIGNPAAQIDAMAQVIRYIYDNNAGGDWLNAAAYYFGGPAGITDEFGMSTGQYASSFANEAGALAQSGWA